MKHGSNGGFFSGLFRFLGKLLCILLIAAQLLVDYTFFSGNYVPYFTVLGKLANIVGSITEHRQHDPYAMPTVTPVRTFSVHITNTPTATARVTSTPERSTTVPVRATVTPAPTAASAIPGVRDSFKKTMDSYAAFMDEYVAFMKSAASNSATLASLKYLSMLSKYAEMCEELDKIDENEVSDAEWQYYLKTQLYISQKLLEVAQ